MMPHELRLRRPIWIRMLAAILVIGALCAPQLGKLGHAQEDDSGPPADSRQALKAIQCDLDGCRVIGYYCLRRCWAAPCCTDT